MSKLRRKRSDKFGLPPGTPVHIGNEKTNKVKITIIDYDEQQFDEEEAKSVEECIPVKDSQKVRWINID
ncbi:MAG: magnesium and cobalt transport protein CorA, partial [Nitrospirota bacterium]|nr:magnesium and cobalt transport protein CorA [Nitrospirota bacterium]